MALTIAIGFVIDDAVIIIENITRLIQDAARADRCRVEGNAPDGLYRALDHSRADRRAHSGPVHARHRWPAVPRFGLTLVVAIVASAIVSLTLTPMMCGQLLKSDGRRPDGRVSAFVERALNGCVAVYGKSLDWTLRRGWLTLIAAVGLTFATVGLYERLPKGFLPTQDTGILSVRTLSRSNVSFEAKSKSQESIAAAITSDPSVEHVASYIGVGPMSVGTMLVSLKPLEVRKELVGQVIDRLRGTLARSEDARVIMVPLQDLNVGAKKSAARYQYTLSGFDRDEVAHWAVLMKERIAQLPQATDVQVNYEKRGLEVNLVMNRVRAARAGATAVDLDNILNDWFGQIRLDLIRFPVNHARVVMEVGPEDPNDPSDVDRLFLTSGLPADILSRRRRDHASMWVPHENGIPSGHRLLQHAAGRLDRRRGGRDPERRSRRPSAQRHPFGIPGRSKARRRNFAIAAVPVPGGGDQHLHHSRHPLRELRPPLHDPIDAAFGRLRRAGRARADAHRIHADRGDRLHTGRRHRHEERDHDG